jgi:hypothetical protein
MTLITIKGLLPRENINLINESLNVTQEELILDLKNLSLNKINELIQKESIAARILSYRFTNSSIIGLLIKHLNEWLAKNKKSGRYYFSPLIMTRICRPGLDVYKNEAMLYTEPHYDKVENLNPYFGVWVPLEPVNDETGGICWFDMPEDFRLKHFPLAGKNLSLKDYSVNFKNVDQMVKPFLRTLDLVPGDVVIFDENCLHGATKPRSKARRSLNFQMIHESTVAKFSDFERDKILLINSDLNICNLINLFHLGDAKFVGRNLNNYSFEKIDSIVLKREISKILAYEKNTTMPTFEKLKQVFPWREEYQWLKNV